MVGPGEGEAPGASDCTGVGDEPGASENVGVGDEPGASDAGDVACGAGPLPTVAPPSQATDAIVVTASNANTRTRE